MVKLDMLAVDHTIVAHGNCLLNDITEFPDVAREMMRVQFFNRGIGHFVIDSGIPCKAFDQHLGQGNDIAPTLAKRWDRYPNPGNPVVEILTKLPFRNECSQVAIRCRNDVDVDCVFLLPAHATKLSGIEHPEKFSLYRQWQFTHLVEEQRPLVRQLKKTGLHTRAPGECTALVAKQFILNQGFGNGRTIQLDIGPSAATGLIVDEARGQFLAHAAFSVDQDPSASLGGHGQAFDTCKKRGRTPHHSHIFTTYIQRPGHKPVDRLHENRASILVFQGVSLDPHVIRIVIRVIVGMQNLEGFIGLEHLSMRAVFTILVTGNLRTMRYLVTTSADDVFFRDTVRPAVTLVCRNNPVFTVDNDCRVLLNIDN